MATSNVLVLQSQIAGEASLVMAAACSCLVAPSPPRPVQDEIWLLVLCPYQSGEQPAHLRYSHGNQFLIGSILAPLSLSPTADYTLH